MPRLIQQASRVKAAGSRPKLIDEYIGVVNSGTAEVSVAHMRSPEGWQEPGQTPDFEEFTLVLRGVLRVDFAGGFMVVHAGQAVISSRGEWIRYSTPEADGGVYRCVFARVHTSRSAPGRTTAMNVHIQTSRYDSRAAGVL